MVWDETNKTITLTGVQGCIFLFLMVQPRPFFERKPENSISKSKMFLIICTNYCMKNIHLETKGLLIFVFLSSQHIKNIAI